MEFEMSPTVGAIADALAKAQGAIEGAKKESENPAFKRDGKAMRYADLASVWDACRAQLSANGVAVVQSPGEAAEGKISVTTLLAHSSGEWFKGYLTIPLSKVDAHGYGSATTYARRYALAAMVGVAPEDDDGNAAIKPGDDAAPNNGKRRELLRPISAEQVEDIEALILDVGADRAKLLSYLKISDITDITTDNFERVKAVIEKKRKPAQEAQ